MNKLRFVLLLALFLQSYQAWSFSEPCQLVAKMAGNNEYQQEPNRIASLNPPADIPKEWKLELLENHGAWYVYQTDKPWFTKENCAPLTKKSLKDNSKVLFMPVLLNKKTGHNAVVTGTFIIKVYHKRDLPKVVKRYGFLPVSPLPNPESMIVEVRTTDSYDLLIQTLDRDKDVDLALPLLSEPR
ncbi:hypothetical protein [Thiomicrorhabdus sp.]|uniref:hypothetical protein n=1 Tax=Thiomicrorhabdus sp. TaxID=2039724 RepID=UPI002AA7857A|nr:hypothetical protein [Thiomicrorhabdus sp.]